MRHSAASRPGRRTRLRGTITAVEANTLTLRSAAGTRSVHLTEATEIATLAEAGLDAIEVGARVAAVTKTVGPTQIALAVVLLPETGARLLEDGRHAWDKRPDTSIPAVPVISLLTLANPLAPSGRKAPVASTLTVGTVRVAKTQGQGRQLVVHYGATNDEAILVPPTAEVAALVHAGARDLVAGAKVLVGVTSLDGRATARFVAVGMATLQMPL